MYSNEIIKNITFPLDISIGEDSLVSIETLLRCSKISYTNYKGYHYTKNTNSLSQTFTRNYLSIQKANEEIINLICQHNKKLIYYAYARSVKCDIASARLASDAQALTKEVYLRIMNHIEKYYDKHSRELLPLKDRGWLMLYRNRYVFIVVRRIISPF